MTCKPCGETGWRDGQRLALGSSVDHRFILSPGHGFANQGSNLTDGDALVNSGTKRKANQHIVAAAAMLNLKTLCGWAVSKRDRALQGNRLVRA